MSLHLNLLYFKIHAMLPLLQVTRTFRYTGHCPTLKFRVGKRFGASTEEIMKVRRGNIKKKLEIKFQNEGDVLIYRET